MAPVLHISLHDFTLHGFTSNVWVKHRYTPDSGPRPYIPPRVSALSAMELNLGVFGFCRAPSQKQTRNQCVHDLRVPCGISCMFNLHAQTAADAVTYAPDEPRLF